MYCTNHLLVKVPYTLWTGSHVSHAIGFHMQTTPVLQECSQMMNFHTGLNTEVVHITIKWHTCTLPLICVSAAFTEQDILYI